MIGLMVVMLMFLVLLGVGAILRNLGQKSMLHFLREVKCQQGETPEI